MLIDSHIHLDSGVYSQDLAELLLRAKEAGVNKLLTPGTTVESSKKCIEIAQNHSGVYAAVGVHPHDADNTPNGYLDSLSDLLSENAVVAVGEIGLDFNKNYSEVESQLSIFNARKTKIKAHRQELISESNTSRITMYHSVKILSRSKTILHFFIGFSVMNYHRQIFLFC